MVQSVLNFGAETWVVTPCMGRFWEGFQDQVARQLTGRLPQQQTYIKWEYTLATAEIEEAVSEVMEAYIWRR